MEDTPNEVVEETVVETPETIEVEPSAVEEPQIEKPLYAGKYKSPEDLEKAYQEAQRLISVQGQKLKSIEEPALAPDKQAIANELAAMGFVTKDQLQHNTAVTNQKIKDDAEIKTLNLTSQQEQVLRAFASNQNNLSKSMSDCWSELSGAIGGVVVKRTTTIKPKASSPSGFKKLSNEELARLPEDEYNKYWANYAAEAEQ